MKILPTALIPREINTLLHIPQKAESLPPLSVGEMVEAEIMEGSRRGKAMILLKGKPIMADSEVPLMKGEKVAVRVAQLHPGVILRVVHGEMVEKSGLLDHLRFYRANPEALSDLLTEGSARFSPEQLGELAAHIGSEDAKTIQDIFRSLLFSGESLKNPLFFREYVHTLGYLMEHVLGETLKGKSARAEHLRDVSQSLKGLLLKVADRLQSLLELRDLPPAQKLAGFVRSSLQAIDSHQVINCLFQEYEGKYMFQVPLLFPENRGAAEIFVKFGGRDSQGKGRHEGKNILFLLDMDALGEIVAEATIVGKKIGCVLKCGDTKTCNFIKPFLDNLREGLAALGYGVDYLQCVVNQGGASMVKERAAHEFQNLFALEGIDFFA